MWTGNVSHIIRQKAKGTRPKRNADRRAARRHTVAGYPIQPRPFTLEEVRAYFKGDRLTCLRCGKPYRSLGVHLLKIHSVSKDEYREMYGLPWREGLAGEQLKENCSIKASTQLLQHDHLEEYRHLCRGAKRKKPQPFRLEMSVGILSKYGLAEGPAEPQAAIDEFLSRVALGRTPKEVGEDEDLPARGWFRDHMKPSDQAKLIEIIHTLPFAFQTKAQMGMSPSFANEIRERRPHLSDHKIAKELGVDAMTVNNHRRKHGIF